MLQAKIPLANRSRYHHQMYTEDKLLTATVHYNKFAHSQHLLGNKTFASSAINEQKHNQMEAAYAQKITADDLKPEHGKFRGTALDPRIQTHQIKDIMHDSSVKSLKGADFNIYSMAEDSAQRWVNSAKERTLRASTISSASQSGLVPSPRGFDSNATLRSCQQKFAGLAVSKLKCSQNSL